MPPLTCHLPMLKDRRKALPRGLRDWQSGWSLLVSVMFWSCTGLARVCRCGAKKTLSTALQLRSHPLIRLPETDALLQHQRVGPLGRMD